MAKQQKTPQDVQRPVDRLVMHYVSGTYDRETACGIPIFSGTELAAGAENPDFCRVLGHEGVFKITCKKCLNA